VTILLKPSLSAISIWGAWAMIIVAILLFVTALVIGLDGWQAYTRYRRAPPRAAPAPARARG
jgi:hypothetical protein